MKKTLQTLLVVSLLAVSSANAQYNKLKDFEDTPTGSSPRGSLVSDGSALYGMTFYGGAYNLGTVFKLNPDGTGYTEILDFLFAGNSPYGSLIYDGTSLYGMAASGGANSFGTIFKINTDGTGFVNLLDFDGVSNGSTPFGSLIYDGSILYGMTHSGGANNDGTVFKINTDGTGYTKLLDFDGTNGQFPTGSLISDGTALYGMTRYGGANGSGTIFKINTDGTGYTQLYSFSWSDGEVPHGSLISDGTTLFGMTTYGGTNNDGTIFKINTDGTVYNKLLDFDGAISGSYPLESLVSDGTTLYGMTSEGGTNNLGTIFNINPDGTGYTKLLDFDGVSNGSNPQGSLIFEGNVLYGMTFEGGSVNVGTVFKYCAPPTFVDAPSNVYLCDIDYTLPSLTVGDYYTETGGSGTMLNAGDVITSTQTLYVYVTTGSCSDENSFDVTIFPTPINTVTINANTLQSDEIGATFQWLDCDNGNAPIAGAISQSFTPTANGSYAVVITKNGCTSTSLCTAITTLNINEYQVNNIKIYPNPTKGSFTIETESIGKNYSITNVLGEVVFQSTIKQKQTAIDISTYPNGLYLLNIEGETVKLIKQ